MPDLRRSDIARPINNQSVNTVVFIYVAVFAALALAYIDTFAKKVLRYYASLSTRIRQHALKSIHLPYIPRNSLGDTMQRLPWNFTAEFRFVKVADRVKQIFTCNNEIVALPLISVNGA